MWVPCGIILYGTWYLVLVPGTCYLVPGTWHLSVLRVRGSYPHNHTIVPPSPPHSLPTPVYTKSDARYSCIIEIVVAKERKQEWSNGTVLMVNYYRYSRRVSQYQQAAGTTGIVHSTYR